MTSGPIPAGSPSETARGATAERSISGASLKADVRSAKFDHRIAAQVAKVALGARIDPLLIDLVVDVVVARRRLVDLIAAADDERPDAFIQRPERLGRLADLHRHHQ